MKQAYVKLCMSSVKQIICCETCFLLQVGDYVFAKIKTDKGFEFYVPAIVIALPNRDVASEKFYTVLKCNNRTVSVCPDNCLLARLMGGS